MMLDKCFSDFDFDSGKITHTPKNATPMIFYYDHDRQTSVDLHLPYIDNYRFEIDGIQYRRIPEVLDCRFESGAMPFGQFHKLDTDRKKFTEYPADFIAE